MKKTKKKITIFLVITISLIVTTTITFGKYVYNSIWNYYLESKGFYFESDLLDINTKKNSLLTWDGSSVYFNIKNSLNKKLISDYNISYKLTCTVLGDEASYIDCILNDTNSSVYNGSLSTISTCINNIDDEDVSSLGKTECEIKGYTWYEEVTSKNNYFNLILKDNTKNIDEVSVKITAESINPYHKTLVGIFNLNKIEPEDSEIITYYENYSEYDELTIINESTIDKCILISFDSNNYSFDLDSNSYLEYSNNLNGKIDSIKIKVKKQNSVNYNFYKINSEKEYSINDFTIEEKEC